MLFSLLFKFISCFTLSNYVYKSIDILLCRTRYYYRIPTSGFGKFENQFLRPLSTGAWACVFAMVVLCAIVLTLAAKLEHRESWGQFAVFSVIAVFCQQCLLYFSLTKLTITLLTHSSTSCLQLYASAILVYYF